jgi:hypothetical protein
MTPAQAKRQAAIHEAMAILWMQQAQLDREMGHANDAQRSDEEAAWQTECQAFSEHIACQTQ